MAPFHEAINIRSGLARGKYQVYTGAIDPEWTVGMVPHGGYVLAIVVEACIQYQSKSKSSDHRDPIHVTAHFLRTTSVSSFEVQIRTLKTGRGFTNIVADLVQREETKVTVHLIFGINAPLHDPKLRPTLASSSSSYARRIPLYTHPSTAIADPMRHTWSFHDKVKWTRESKIQAKNQLDSPSRTDTNTIGGEGLEWGTWFEFLGNNDKITNPSLAFLVDIFLNLPNLLPRSERVGLTRSWFPTMTLAMEFKSPIPPASRFHASRTVGLYSSGKFLNDPQGRHDAYVEVWTAPCNIGEGTEVERWREHQVCLAVATQMALTVPMEVNQRQAKKDYAKL